MTKQDHIDAILAASDIEAQCDALNAAREDGVDWEALPDLPVWGTMPRDDGEVYGWDESRILRLASYSQPVRCDYGATDGYYLELRPEAMLVGVFNGWKLLREEIDQLFDYLAANEIGVDF